MPLHFVDATGEEGWVDDDLSLAYDGSDEIAEQVETCIEAVEAGPETGDDALGALVVEFPVGSEIQRIERVDGHADATED